MESTLLAIDVKTLLEALERKVGVKLPRKVVEISLTEGVLHIRFEHPETVETDVEPLPTETPVYLFRDEKTGRVTALEILDVKQLLEELGQLSKDVA